MHQLKMNENAITTIDSIPLRHSRKQINNIVLNSATTEHIGRCLYITNRTIIIDIQGIYGYKHRLEKTYNTKEPMRMKMTAIVLIEKKRKRKNLKQIRTSYE